jgi:transcriptional antiterminator RfaH
MKRNDGNWFILYTKSQQELKVCERLNKIDIEAYCPAKEEIKQWSDRKKKVIVPLIKSYVFVRIEAEEREKVFDVPGVVRYLFWLGKPAIAFEKEIETLQDSLLKPYSSVKVDTLVPGERMTITSGPFNEKEGTIVKVNSNFVTVALEQLGLLVTLGY